MKMWMTAWDDLAARVRGLSSHLLGQEKLRRLAAAPDLRALARDLRETDYGAAITSDAPNAAELDLAVRRVAAKRLAVVSRWAQHRRAALAVVFEDEDRRSLSAMLRGAAAGVPAEQRLAGLIPTPSLPERALEALAAQPAAAAVSAMLLSWQNPYGAALQAEATRAKPDLQSVESVLDRTYAQRARRAAGRSGELRRFVAETIDSQNVQAAFVLAHGSASAASDAAFIDGGRSIERATFTRAASEPVPAAALLRLRREVRDPVLIEALQTASSPAGFERAALRARTRYWRRRARVQPLGAAPVLAYVLRLRAEAMDLRTIAWGLALGAMASADSFAAVSP
jgi:vacuolar-type H+-ATPase subunit C/Vma6